MVEFGYLEREILVELAVKGKISNITQFAKKHGLFPMHAIVSVRRLREKKIVKTVKKGRIVEVFLCRKNT